MSKCIVQCIVSDCVCNDVQVLNEASVEDNLIDLGPGSPAVVTPRASTAATPTPPSSLNAAASAPSLSTQLAGLSKTRTCTIMHLTTVMVHFTPTAGFR